MTKDLTSSIPSEFFDDISLDEPKNIFENCINEISKKDDINKKFYILMSNIFCQRRYLVKLLIEWQWQIH